jgi:hypothetical protein
MVNHHALVSGGLSGIVQLILFWRGFLLLGRANDQVLRDICWLLPEMRVREVNEQRFIHDGSLIGIQVGGREQIRGKGGLYCLNLLG